MPHRAAALDPQSESKNNQIGMVAKSNKVMGNIAGVVETLARSLRGERELD